MRDQIGHPSWFTPIFGAKPTVLALLAPNWTPAWQRAHVSSECAGFDKIAWQKLFSS